MDIYHILKKEHEEVKEMLEQAIKSKESGGGEDLFSEIQSTLSAHMEGEEKVFYPRLEDEEESRDKVLESYEEHHVAKGVLKELLRMSQQDDRWFAKLSVMKELIDHHVQEEERNIFRLARNVLDKEEAEEVGNEYLEKKERLMQKSRKK